MSKVSLNQTTSKHSSKPIIKQSISKNTSNTIPYILKITSLSIQEPLTWAYSTDHLSSNSIQILNFNQSEFKILQSLNTNHPSNGQIINELKSTFKKTELLNNGLPIIELRGSSTDPFLSFDFSLDGHLLAASSGDENQSKIELFDTRSNPIPLHTYTESHSDLITSLNFHPTEHHKLLSASTDGLIVTYDVRLVDEEDGVISTGNVGASLARSKWSGDGKLVWTETDMETIAVWDAEDLGLIQDFGDIRLGELERPHSSWNDSTSYLIDSTNLPKHLDPIQSRFAYFSGSQSGDVSLIEPSHQQNAPWNLLASFKGGHTDIVRSAIVDERSGMILTGGEDGNICLWPNVFEQDMEMMDTTSEDKAQKTGPEFNSPTIKQVRYKPY
ncbi:WD40-repeat-containing domain protein [Melampsora americana]|nr:WD40-repeat-containing domain protein [Melampsora americana]